MTSYQIKEIKVKRERDFCLNQQMWSWYILFIPSSSSKQFLFLFSFNPLSSSNKALRGEKKVILIKLLAFGITVQTEFLPSFLYCFMPCNYTTWYSIFGIHTLQPQQRIFHIKEIAPLPFSFPFPHFLLSNENTWNTHPQIYVCHVFHFNIKLLINCNDWRDIFLRRPYLL